MMSKNSPQLRFEGFTDDWEERKLNEVSDIYDGTHQTPKYQDDGVMFLSVENIKTLTSNKFISREAFEDEFKIRPQRGDVLMTRIGDIGTANVVETDEDLAYYVSLALFKSEELNPYFLQASIYAPFVQDQIWKRTLHIAFPKKINKNEIGQVPINVPTLAEQTKIGSFFKQLDNTIALHQRKLDLLKEQKKGYLQKMFTKNGAKVPELRFAGFADDWEQRKLKDIFDVHTDFVSNGSFQALKENVQLYKTENYAYMIRLQDASNNWEGPWLYTDKQGFDFLDKSTVYKDDILMSDRGTIGKFFLVPQLDKPMTLSSNAVLLRSTKNDNNFIYYMLNTSNISNQIIVRTTPGVQPMISKTEFKKINTCIPNIEEQQKIGSFFHQLDETIALHQRKLDLLKEQKKGFLQKMFV